MHQEAGHIKNIAGLIFRHMMYSEVAWVLVSSRTQVQPQLILNPDYLLECRSTSYGYDEIKQRT